MGVGGMPRGLVEEAGRTWDLRSDSEVVSSTLAFSRPDSHVDG